MISATPVLTLNFTDMKTAKAMTFRLSEDQAIALETVSGVENLPVSDIIQAAIETHRSAA